MCPPPHDSFFALSLRLGHFFDLDVALFTSACANASTIAVLTASVRPRVTAAATILPSLAG